MTAGLIAPVSDRPTVRPVGPSLPAMVGIEARKSLSTRSGVALVVAAMVLAPAAAGVIAAASSDDLVDAAGPIAVMGLLTGYLLIALGVLATAGEWSHRTVQTTYLLVPGRGRVLTAKVAAVAVLGAVSAAVSTALTAGALALLEDVTWDGAPRAMVVAVVAGAAFAVTGAGVGAVVANTPASLTALYLVLLGVLPVVSGFKPEVAEKIDPANAVLELGQGAAPGQPIAVLAAWVVIPVVAGWVLTRRRAAA